VKNKIQKRIRRVTDIEKKRSKEWSNGE